jgi:molybdopterin-guanine dinucleotide biosynthesis protein A
VPAWTAVVLTGGRSSRLGTDKAAVRVGGQPLLHRVVTSIPHGVPVIICGPPPDPEPPGRHTLTREDPQGGGPVAGLAAALPLVRTPVLVLLATDLPLLGDLPERLAQRLGSADALLAQDHGGREQPLLAAYRTAALRRVLGAIGAPAGVSMWRLIAGLNRATLPVPATTVDPTMDVDTAQDLARARGAAMMQDWIDAVRLDLGTGGELDVDAVLDVARDVAHHVQRPAAPVTTYLLGLAVGSGIPLHEAAGKIRELAAGWAEDQ